MRLGTAMAASGFARRSLERHDESRSGALYSLTRYEQERKSQNRYDRTRSTYFDRDQFYRDGVRFDRRSVTRNGQRYYPFQRSR